MLFYEDDLRGHLESLAAMRDLTNRVELVFVVRRLNRAITILQDFVKAGRPYFNTKVGLCGATDLNLNVLVYKWEHFSGEFDYPVPSTSVNHSSPIHAYYELPLYEGKQLALRIDLAKFILAELATVNKTIQGGKYHESVYKNFNC